MELFDTTKAGEFSHSFPDLLAFEDFFTLLCLSLFLLVGTEGTSDLLGVDFLAVPELLKAL